MGELYLSPKSVLGEQSDRVDPIHPFTLQAELMNDAMSNAGMSKKIITTFVDSSLSINSGKGAANHSFATGDATGDTAIKDHFSRPVRIDSYTWNESDSEGYKNGIRPWKLWANNPFVKTKLNNYSWFRGDLKIKIQMTASPFYYGMTKVTYVPLQYQNPAPIDTSAGLNYFVCVSQRPHITMVAGEHTSYEMTLPFLFQSNFANVQQATALENLGALDYHIFSKLQSANGVTSAGITVTTYAWVENLTLSGASVAFAMQSDEYQDEGCISTPASAIANAAGHLETIPVIGVFATATRMAASAVAGIARLFGYSNPPVLENTMPVRPEWFPKLASTSISYPVEKLTVDAKAELTIDPKVTGLNTSDDELNIKNIVTKESYLTKVSWTTAATTDAILFYSRVNPLMFDVLDYAAPLQSKIYMTPMCWISNCFDQWRGTIIFRFHIVSSRFHRGRLVISFDPSGNTGASNLLNTTSTSGVVYTAIVDIAETNDVEFEVPYQQAAQFLTLRTSFNTSNLNYGINSPPGGFDYNTFVDPLYDNGCLSVRVLNVLTAPVASAPIDIQVYVRAGSDLEFANPTEIDPTKQLSLFKAQTDEYNIDAAMTTVPIDAGMGNKNEYLVHFGERITSMRQLLRRYDLISMDKIQCLASAANQYGTFKKRVFKAPISPGYVPAANDATRFGASPYVANTIVAGTTTTWPYNWCQFTLLSYISNAFVCQRGSTNYTFNLDCTGAKMQHLRVYRENTLDKPTAIAPWKSAVMASSYTDTYTNNSQFANIVTKRPTGRAGSAMTNPGVAPSLNVSIPNQSPFKFSATSPVFANQGDAGDGSLYDAIALEGHWPTGSTTADSVVIYTYVAAGIDYTLNYFLNVPMFYRYNTFPTPA